MKLMLPTSVSTLLHLLLLLAEVRAFEAPEDKQDVFATKACPAFLTFSNAAYLAGVTVELPCHCKPQQVQSVVWFFRKHLSGAEETRALTDHHGNKLPDSSRVPHGSDLRDRFSIRLFSLLIFRAGPDDAGVYICGSARQDFFYGYDLDIQEARVVQLKPGLSPNVTMKKNKRWRKSKRLGPSQPPYRVFTNFQPWLMCDRCGVPGEQVRVGLCYVHSRHLHVRYRRANQTVASCGSGAVPESFGQLKRSDVGAKMEVRGCHVSCARTVPPSSTLVALMVFLGYSSASTPAEVPVYYLSHPADGVFTLGCPGARPNMAVAWDRGSEPIYRYEQSAGGNISVAAHPRLRIDTGHHLVFQPAQIEDSGTYYCWLQGRRAAEIKLLIYPRFRRGQSLLSHPEFPEAVQTILRSYAAMLAVFSLLLVAKTALRYSREAADIKLNKH